MSDKKCSDVLVIDYIFTILGVWIMCIIYICLVPFLPKRVDMQVFKTGADQ